MKPKDKKITSECCRVCLKKCKRSDKNISKKQSQSYQECTGFTVKAEDIPKKICEDCRAALKQFVKFRSLATNTEKYLETLTPPESDNYKIDFAEIKLEWQADDNESFYEMIDESSRHSDLHEQADQKEAIENGAETNTKELTELKPSPKPDLPPENFLEQSESDTEPSQPEKIPKKYTRKCHLCAMQFSTCHRIEKHLQKCHKDEIEPFYCDLCEESRPFMLKLMLRRHMSSVHLKKPKHPGQYTCPHCSRVLSTKGILDGHISRLHTNVKAFMCQFCAQGFTVKEKLQRHLSNKHFDQYTGEKFYCKFCNKGYLDKPALRAHVNFLHLKIRTKLRCKECDYTTYAQNLLDTHTGRVHMTMEDWKYTCPICSKKFILKSQLKFHVDGVHKQERKVSCPECDATFQTKSKMQQHFTAIHNPGSYPCPQCSKVFASARYLAQHMKTHQRDTYRCPLCPLKEFSFTTTLRAHIISHHPEIPPLPKRTTLKNFDWSKLGF